LLEREFEIRGGDFSSGGKVSIAIKTILKELGLPPEILRRLAIATYEAEMNVVLYAHDAKLTLNLTPEKISIMIIDHGPGINDIEKAMQEGYSTATDAMRELGFGAGMGLPNIKRNVDYLQIDSEVGKGTSILMEIKLNSNN